MGRFTVGTAAFHSLMRNNKGGGVTFERYHYEIKDKKTSKKNIIRNAQISREYVNIRIGRKVEKL